MCKDCGNIFYPITSITTTADNSIMLSTYEPRMLFYLNNIAFIYGDKLYVPKIEEINGKKVIVLEEEKSEDNDSE